MGKLLHCALEPCECTAMINARDYFTVGQDSFAAYLIALAQAVVQLCTSVFLLLTGMYNGMKFALATTRWTIEWISTAIAITTGGDAEGIYMLISWTLCGVLSR
jgi:uncharacterized membrane protein